MAFPAPPGPGYGEIPLRALGSEPLPTPSWPAPALGLEARYPVLRRCRFQIRRQSLLRQVYRPQKETLPKRLLFRHQAPPRLFQAYSRSQLPNHRRFHRRPLEGLRPIPNALRSRGLLLYFPDPPHPPRRSPQPREAEGLSSAAPSTPLDVCPPSARFPESTGGATSAVSDQRSCSTTVQRSTAGLTWRRNHCGCSPT